MLEAAEKYGSVFMKPDNGMQGRGVISAEPAENGAWLVRGRDPRSRPFRSVQQSLGDAAAMLCGLAGNSRYIVQPQLPLSDRQGRPFDIRALVQKDGRGEWRLTGTAMRRGRPGGIASNLHGGGEALPAIDGLETALGSELAQSVSQRLDRCALAAAAAAESEFGRLAELGLDFGVEPGGRLWLLEMNSRPGRESFSSFPGGTSRAAVERPLPLCPPAMRRAPGTACTGRRTRLIDKEHSHSYRCPTKRQNVQEVPHESYFMQRAFFR